MAKKDEQIEEEIDKKNLKAWLEYKEKALDFLNEYDNKVKRAKSSLDKPIEKDNMELLRAQISETFTYVPDMSLLAAKAERQYREMQKEASLRFPIILKSDARKMWLDGECANFRYQRDIFDYLLQGLRDKLKAMETVAYSLGQEMKEQRLSD